MRVTVPGRGTMGSQSLRDPSTATLSPQPSRPALPTEAQPVGPDFIPHPPFTAEEKEGSSSWPAAGSGPAVWE